MHGLSTLLCIPGPWTLLLPYQVLKSPSNPCQASCLVWEYLSLLQTQ